MTPPGAALGTSGRPRPPRRSRAVAGAVAALLAALAALLPGDGRAVRAVSGDDAAVAAALADLESSRTAAAEKALKALDAEGAQGPPVELLRSRIAFFQGRYDDAWAALESIPQGSLGRGWEEYRRLVRQTLDATRGFTEVRSAHFRFRFAPGPDEVLAPLAMDALERIHARVGEALGYYPDTPVLIEVLPTGSAFVAASGIGREAVDTTGTIALCKWDRILITSPRAVARGYPWIDTLNHEYVHLAVARLSGNQVPVWLQEGLAHFLENRWRDGEPGELSPYEETLLAEAVRTGEYVTFEQMHPSMAYLPSAEASTLAFAEVTTAVQYLVRRVGMAGLQRVIDTAAELGDASPAIEKVTGEPFSRFEAGWKSFLGELRLREIAQVGGLKRSVVDAPPPGNPQDPGGEQRDGILEADRARMDFTRLGDLLRLRGRFRAALIEYRKAETAAPLHSPALANKIARALLGAGRYAEARDALLQSKDLYPQYPATRIALGEAYRGLKDAPSARRELEASLQLNPYDPRVRAWLAEIYQAAGEGALAERERRALAALHGGRP